MNEGVAAGRVESASGTLFWRRAGESVVSEISGHPPGALDDKTSGGDPILDGGVAGAQRSLQERAAIALDEALPLLEKIELLKGDSTAADVVALKILIRSEMVELLGELSLTSGPSISRVEHIFVLLLDQLAALQEGITDEDNLSHFRIVTDNVASLYRSWNNVQQLFGAQTGIVTKMFGLVTDAVEDLRQTMDAVFLGAEERQGMMISYMSGSSDGEAISLEDLMNWIQDFMAGEAPHSLDQAGGFALRNTIAPMARKLRALVLAAMEHRNLSAFPKRFSSPALQRAVKNMEGRLDELAWNC